MRDPFRDDLVVGASSFTVAGVNPNLRTSYMIQWNLNIQRELTNSTVMEIGYAGSKGNSPQPEPERQPGDRRLGPRPGKRHLRVGADGISPGLIRGSATSIGSRTVPIRTTTRSRRAWIGGSPAASRSSRPTRGRSRSTTTRAAADSAVVRGRWTTPGSSWSADRRSSTGRIG